MVSYTVRYYFMIKPFLSIICGNLGNPFRLLDVSEYRGTSGERGHDSGRWKKGRCTPLIHIADEVWTVVVKQSVSVLLL